jgi:hypothetical protein
MSQANDLPDLSNALISDEMIEATYIIATSHLRDNDCSFIFNQPNKYKRIEEWYVSTWSRYVSFQFIQENGSDTDKQNLPPPTHLNNKRKRR